MQIEFADHPAKTKVPAAPGYAPTYLPKFPNQRLVKVNGLAAAYLSLTSGGLSFLRRYPQTVILAVEEKVKEQFDAIEQVISSQPPEIPDEDDDE